MSTSGSSRVGFLRCQRRKLTRDEPDVNIVSRLHLRVGHDVPCYRLRIENRRGTSREPSVSRRSPQAARSMTATTRSDATESARRKPVRHDDHPCHECSDEGEEIREDVLERSFDVDGFASRLLSDHVADDVHDDPDSGHHDDDAPRHARGMDEATHHLESDESTYTTGYSVRLS